MGMTPYAALANTTLDECREWAQKYDKPLPVSPWDIPKDCPIWQAQELTLFQASWILARLHEMRGNDAP